MNKKMSCNGSVAGNNWGEIKLYLIDRAVAIVRIKQHNGRIVITGTKTVSVLKELFVSLLLKTYNYMFEINFLLI